MVGKDEGLTANEFRRFIAVWILRIIFTTGLVLAFPELLWWAWIPIGLGIAAFTDWIV